ncbi:radical SAM protein, partial [Candidatus Bathyarchaeota archaeon]|nr:radical SAM protein [Candidatus Bathyarchaeota archaeon]
AQLHCLNLLLTYEKGCKANCAFCGLCRERKHSTSNQEKSFIRVTWPVVSVQEVVNRLKTNRSKEIWRVCISMVTRKQARDDTLTIADALESTGLPVSVLLCPTIISKRWLLELKRTVVDKVGIAIDAATEDLFNELRGKNVKGPHSWDKYWETVSDTVAIFGAEHASIHLMVGIGETEKDIVQCIQKAKAIGVDTHLFSFFPEPGSAMETHPQPGIGTYRRIQLAREAMYRDLTTTSRMSFNESGQIEDLGMMEEAKQALINEGTAFLTQGCKDERTGMIACNRPFSNSTPFQAARGELRNFPFQPTREDIKQISKQLADYNVDSWVRPLDATDDFLLDDS